MTVGSTLLAGFKVNYRSCSVLIMTQTTLTLMSQWKGLKPVAMGQKPNRTPSDPPNPH